MLIDIYAESGNTKIKLLQPFYFGYNNNDYLIEKGFVSDGQSVPRILWRLLDPPISGVTLTASIKHDFLYRYRYITRKEADKLYYHDLKSNGWPIYKCIIVYIGLRLFGWYAWNRHKKS